MSQGKCRAHWLFAAALGFVVMGQVSVAQADRDHGRDHGRGNGRTTAVPEIPAGGASAALTLLLGAAAIAVDRRRRKAK